MKRIGLVLAVVVVILLLTNTVFAGDFFFDTVMDKTISTSTAAKIVSLQGYREFSMLARFEGAANSEFAFEIAFNQIPVIRETVKLNSGGWFNFAKVYPVYSPNVGVSIYNPPANLKAKIMLYAGH